VGENRSPFATTCGEGEFRSHRRAFEGRQREGILLSMNPDAEIVEPAYNTP
jgi:hypothetical protein